MPRGARLEAAVRAHDSQLAREAGRVEERRAAALEAVGARPIKLQVVAERDDSRPAGP